MADDLIVFTEEAEGEGEAKTGASEISNFPQTLVTEKIIFCVDILTLSSEYGDGLLIATISSLLKSYFNLKKKICVRPEFEFLLVVNNDTINYSYINTAKDIESAIVAIQHIAFEEEEEPLEIDKVFNKIASLVEFPDPENCNKSLPPESVYHVIWLFSRNLYIPTMEDTNSYDFLMMTPYFALDILYIHNTMLKLNKCNEIAAALLGLNDNKKGYFLSANIGSKMKINSAFAQMLGHPLMRPPQIKAKYNITELGPPVELTEKDNEEHKVEAGEEGEKFEANG